MLIFLNCTFQTIDLISWCPQISIESATPFHDIQKLVERLIAGKIIIGHTLWHDLNGMFPSWLPPPDLLDISLVFRFLFCALQWSHLVLQLCHNERQTRDLALFMPFKCFGKFNHDFKTLISKLSPIYYDKIEHEGPVLQTPVSDQNQPSNDLWN